MIRHYEKIGLIPPPPRRDGGYRDYSEPDVHRLRFIANARDLGFPIEEIGKLLDLWADGKRARSRSEEHTSELQSLNRITYAVLCLKQKTVYISPITSTGHNQQERDKKTN